MTNALTRPLVFLATLITVLLTQLNAQSTALMWAQHFGGSAQAYAEDLATNDSGNVVIVGEFQGAGDFDPGPGTFSMTSLGSTDIFVSKFDPAGNFLWSKQIAGQGGSPEFGSSIATDHSGNIYFTGNFIDSADFDPGPSTFYLHAAGQSDVFIIKLDLNGNFIWAVSAGGTGTDWGHSIAVDSASNVYAGGKFSGTADFDPGIGTMNLTSNGQEDFFVARFDQLGNLDWAKNIGGAGNDVCFGLDIDQAGNVYCTGHFTGPADFDPGPGSFILNGAGSKDIFICKIDPSGNFSWAKEIGGSNHDGGNDIIVSDNGSIFLTGIFMGQVDFDPGSGVNIQTTGAWNEGFVSRFDTAGNHIWAGQFAGQVNPQSVTLDNFDNVLTTGYFMGTADFDPSSGVTNLISAGSYDIFISKLDVGGNYIWSGQMGGVSADYGESIGTDAFGNIYTTGFFSGTSDFDPDAGSFNLTSSGLDAFIHKMGSTVGIEEDAPGKEKIFPNPTNGMITIENFYGSYLLASIEGRVITLGECTGQPLALDLANESSGIYVLRMQNKTKAKTYKIIRH